MKVSWAAGLLFLALSASPTSALQGGSGLTATDDGVGGIERPIDSQTNPSRSHPKAHLDIPCTGTLNGGAPCSPASPPTMRQDDPSLSQTGQHPQPCSNWLGFALDGDAALHFVISLLSGLDDLHTGPQKDRLE